MSKPGSTQIVVGLSLSLLCVLQVACTDGGASSASSGVEVSGRVQAGDLPVRNATVRLVKANWLDSILGDVRPSAAAGAALAELDRGLEKAQNVLENTPWVTTTGTEGQFSLHAPPGRYRVFVSAHGLCSGTSAVSTESRSPAKVFIALRRGAQVRGVVVGPSLEPLSGAYVLPRFNPSGRGVLSRLIGRLTGVLSGARFGPTDGVRTDATGRFSISDCPMALWI